MQIKNGKSYGELAKQYHVSKTTIMRIARRYRVRSRHKFSGNTNPNNFNKTRTSDVSSEDVHPDMYNLLIVGAMIYGFVFIVLFGA